MESRTKNKDNRRQKATASTKKNWCKYCSSFQTKMARHMTALHKDIPEVQKYLSLTNKTEKRELCKNIINLSNKVFNENVLNDKVIGNMIPVKKAKTEASFTTHVVCSTCGGLFRKKYFYSHKQTCSRRQEILGLKSNIPSSEAVNKDLNHKYKLLKEKVINNMNNDNIKLTIMNDFLILEFGRRFFKCHMSTHQRNYVSTKMRTLADLVLRVKKLNPNVIELKDCLDPLNFNVLCEAVKKWSEYSEDNGICTKGSVPRRLCKSLKSCSQILWSEAIKNEALSFQQQLEFKTKHKRFMSLMSSDWQMEINSAADKSLKIKKVLGEGKMPLEEDLITYFEGLSRLLQSLLQKVVNECTKDYFDQIVQATLAFLIAFNSRRPGEVAHATIESYKKIIIDTDQTKNEPLAVFYVAATKNDTKVPVIMPHITHVAVDTILKYRTQLNIPGNIIFSKQNGAAYNGSEIVNKFKSKIILKKPYDFTANGIRHFWATMSQTDTKLKQHMPKFLGHTLATHQKYYEMPLAEIQLKLIGPVLEKTCLSSHKAEDFHQTLFDRPLREKKVAETSGEKKVEQPSVIKMTPRRTHPNRKLNKEKQNCMLHEPAASDQSSLPDDTSEDPDFELNSSPPKKKILAKRKIHQTSSSDDESITSAISIAKKNPWITPEKNELFDSLPETILGIKPAGRGKIQDLWENSKVIKTRHSLQTTRIEVSKYFTKKKKVSTPIKKKLLQKIGDPTLI